MKSFPPLLRCVLYVFLCLLVHFEDKPKNGSSWLSWKSECDLCGFWFLDPFLLIPLGYDLGNKRLI